MRLRHATHFGVSQIGNLRCGEGLDLVSLDGKPISDFQRSHLESAQLSDLCCSQSLHLRAAQCHDLIGVQSCKLIAF